MKKLLIALAGFVVLFAATTRKAEVYREATSSDGSWSVTVLRKKNRLYPLMEGVDVIVRIKDREKRTVFDHVIDNRDLWTDVEARYPEVICTNDAIAIGPSYWDGNAMTWFRVNKSLASNLRPGAK